MAVLFVENACTGAYSEELSELKSRCAAQSGLPALDIEIALSLQVS